MPLTPEQERAVRSPGSVAVTAGAGTGKTHLLTQRYLHHLTEDGWSPLEIVAVTFTEKAAEELRSRIRQAVRLLPDGSADTLAEIEAAQISTIHSLAQRICRDHYHLAGIPPDFKVMDEQEGAIWRAEHFALALEAIPLSTFRKLPFSKLSQAMRTFLNDPRAANEALALGPEDWAAFCEAARTEALRQLRGDAAWVSSGQVLRSIEGMPDDLIELQRLAAVAAWTAVESDSPPVPHLEVLFRLNMRGGSQKKWPPDSLAVMKSALTQLRDLVRAAHPLTTLELCDADRYVAEVLPQLREAFALVQEYFANAKLRKRVLDFNDLESYALEILRHPAAYEFYQQRWKAFLIDEFQDTNPVQGELLELLTKGARVTIVGDEQQSIYGFRRADVQVFADYRERIQAEGGDEHQLSVTYRAHTALTENVNGVFAPVLGVLHRPLSAARADAPHDAPHFTALVVQTEEKTSKTATQRVEAAAIARTVRGWIDEGLLVHDKPTNQPRPVRPGDIAVLSRTWNALDYYGDAFSAANIPAVHGGGGSLLATREVMDAIGLLTFLADPLDDLALVATLRGPFFALSDADLYRFANTLGRKHWWQVLVGQDPPGFARALPVLNELLAARRALSPRQLLQLADSLTGYGAVIANLPQAARREADRRGFLELLSRWEREGFDDVFTAVRQLRILTGAEVELPRPPLEAGNAVAMMTVHAAKGLEWPIVIVPDLARTSRSESARVRLDPKLGVAFTVGDDDDEQKPAILTLIDQRRKQREAAENGRVLYVAITRARDRVLLTSTAPKGPGVDILTPGLEAVGIPWEEIPFNVTDAAPPMVGEPPALAQPERILLDAVPRTVGEIRITDLHEYSLCPKRFHYHVVLGYPDPTREEADGSAVDGEAGNFNSIIGEEVKPPVVRATSAAVEELPLFAALSPVPPPPPEPPAVRISPAEARSSRRIGILAHRALELGMADIETLAGYDKSLTPEQVAEALSLANRFRQDPAFAQFQGPANELYRREWQVTAEVNDIRLIGTIDLAGPDFVLDFKTGRNVTVDEHRFQLWAYARAAGVDTAYLADLRNGALHAFDSANLATIELEVNSLLDGIRSGKYSATPSTPACSNCPYRTICPDSMAK